MENWRHGRIKARVISKEMESIEDIVAASVAVVKDAKPVFDDGFADKFKLVALVFPVAGVAPSDDDLFVSRIPFGMDSRATESAIEATVFSRASDRPVFPGPRFFPFMAMPHPGPFVRGQNLFPVRPVILAMPGVESVPVRPSVIPGIFFSVHRILRQRQAWSCGAPFAAQRLPFGLESNCHPRVRRFASCGCKVPTPYQIKLGHLIILTKFGCCKTTLRFIHMTIGVLRT